MQPHYYGESKTNIQCQSLGRFLYLYQYSEIQPTAKTLTVGKLKNRIVRQAYLARI